MHSKKFLAKGLMTIGLTMGILSAAPPASAHLQCAPYAREVSGINLRGNASGWWDQASGIYARGQTPRAGSVLAFRATRAMPFGHVAMVRSVVDARHVLLNHANWSRPGMVERAALAEDVSERGDWSQVRVWYAPIGSLGLRTTPAYGFIYPRAARADLADGDTGSRASVAAAGTDMAANNG